MNERLKGFLGNLRRGFVRFAPFNVGAVLLAAFLVWHNHIPWKERETAVLLPISLACGVCWGMLAALAARLALERRSARPRLLSVLPAVGGILATVAGAWFWYHVRDGHVFYYLWRMIYFGGITALASAAVANLFGTRNRLTLFGQVFQSAVFVGMISLVTMLGGYLCLEAYRELIFKISNDFMSDVATIVWCAVAPVFMAACLPHDDAPTERSRWYNVLFWFLTPLGLVLVTILYAYIGKIVIRWEMPSGKMNWFASWALAGYLFFWLSLRASRVRFFAFVARWGWVALIPVVVTQIVGIVIRYQAHGLTTPRMAGMVTLAIGIYALVLAALDRDAKSIFTVTAVAGIVFTVTPLNIVDIPMREQSARLRRMLARNGCLGSDGKLVVPEKPEIPLADAKMLVGAWRYLTDSDKYRPASTNAPPLRPGVWYRAAFAQDVLKAVVSRKKEGHLPSLLKIDESKLVDVGRSRTYTYHSFELEHSEELDITGFSRMRRERYFTLELGQSQRRYYVTVNDIPQTNRFVEAKTAYEVTEYMDRIVSATDAKLKWTNGRYNNNYKLPNDLALWSLSSNLTLAVTKISFSLDLSRTNSFSGSVSGNLLIRR